MRQLGHSSPAAALLYLLAADDRDADIARALDAMLGAANESSDGDPDPDNYELPGGRWVTLGSRRIVGSHLGHER